MSTANRIGVREGRRIHGRYVVSSEDLRDGTRHEDCVCHVRFGIDVHTTNPKRSNTKDFEAKPFRAQPYDIPYRALLACDAGRLLLAGRCISGDFFAHASYRVTGNAVEMGQAAGVAAAVAAKVGRPPHELNWVEQIKPQLHELINRSTAVAPYRNSAAPAVVTAEG